MDEDTKIIEELRDRNNYLKDQISNLERALKQSTANQEKLKMENSNEILKSREIIDDLNKKLTNCMNTIDAKNTELLNLQTALGQYYAEIEAKVLNFFIHKLINIIVLLTFPLTFLPSLFLYVSIYYYILGVS